MRPTHLLALVSAFSAAVEVENTQNTLPASSSATCQIWDNKDLKYGDVKSASASSAAACCDLCSKEPTCGSATWNSYNGGTCWMKYCYDGCPLVDALGSFSMRIKVPAPIDPPQGFCNPDVTYTSPIDETTVSAATFNLLTTDVRPWDPRKCAARKIFSDMKFPDFVVVEEGSMEMIKDLLSYSGKQRYFTLNGQYAGFTKAYLPGLEAERALCYLKDGPCNVWGTYDNCQGPGIEQDQGFMLLYKNSEHITLLQGGRKQFGFQQGCPRSEVVRNYEFGVFKVGSKIVVVYGTHLAWPQATQGNNAQTDELYNDAVNNYRGSIYRPFYNGPDGTKFQLDVQDAPFLIVGDLNSFANENKWQRSGIRLDGNSQWDWVISGGPLTRTSTRNVPITSVSDHEHAVVVTWNLAASVATSSIGSTSFTPVEGGAAQPTKPGAVLAKYLGAVSGVLLAVMLMVGLVMYVKRCRAAQKREEAYSIVFSNHPLYGVELDSM